MTPSTSPKHVLFDPTPEIFATDSAGNFAFRLAAGGEAFFALSPYDETRFVFSIWHPSGNHSIDLDRAYVEIRASFNPEDDHLTKLAEIEPVVPPYSAGDTFDGWIVLPVLGAMSSFTLFGSGFEPRARLQVRANGYFVA